MTGLDEEEGCPGRDQLILLLNAAGTLTQPGRLGDVLQPERLCRRHVRLISHVTHLHQFHPLWVPSRDLNAPSFGNASGKAPTWLNNVGPIQSSKKTLTPERRPSWSSAPAAVYRKPYLAVTTESAGKPSTSTCATPRCSYPLPYRC